MIQSNIVLISCQDAISVLERVEKFKSFIKTFGTVICFSVLMFSACELESFRVAFQSCVLETLGVPQAALQRRGKGSSLRGSGVPQDAGVSSHITL